MLNIFKKLFILRSVSAGGQKNRKIFLAVIFIVIIAAFLFSIKYVIAAETNPLATLGNWGSGTLGWAVSIVLALIAYVITAVVGLLITLMVQLLMQVAQYGNIINVPTVINGWVIIRDLCNMLFILILLVIAFATILRIESYNYKKILPKLLIMAILINFSRTIFGLLVDFSQVIMLTFVNGFNNGAGWFIKAFNTDLLLAIRKSTQGTSGDYNVTAWATSMAIIAGVIAAIITLIVVSVMLAILVMRIIMLWIYTIFSPLIFLGFAVPAIQKYTGKIWEDFIKQLVVGPVLAFFLWLALTTASTSSKSLLDDQNLISGGSGEVCVGAGKFFCNSDFQQFLIVIGLLMGGLMVAQQMGGVAGSLAGGALGKIKSAGIGLAKGAGKTAAYIPAQYAKEAAYKLGDMALGQLSKAPIIGNLAMEGKGRLRMHRDYAEEKDTKYMQYLDEKDLDKIIARQRSTSIISTLGKGMESKRQMFRRASVEKDKRGDEWGQSKEEKMANKTGAAIELLKMAGHSITSSGEDAFRDAELGKLYHEFRNKNAGMIDDEQMRTYFFGGEGNAMGPDGKRTGPSYKYKGLKGAANSEYYRVGGWKDPLTGYWYESEDPDKPGHGKGFVSPNSMGAYTVMRQRMGQVFDTHHENFAPWKDEDGKEHYTYLEALYDDSNGPMKTFAQVRDRGTRQQKISERAFIKHKIIQESALGWNRSTKNKDTYEKYLLNNKLGDPSPENLEKYLDAAMRNRGIGEGDVFGASRPIMGQTHSVEAASGITGLGRINHGVMAASFGELGLESSAAKYFDGADKAKIANRIGGSLRDSGIAEDVAKAVEDQINQASYLILHNKDAGVSPSETRTAHAHELMHARVGANFSQDELKGVWNSMDENSRNGARKQISAKWGANMSEDAIMNEYFAEGLTAKTRWGKGAVVSLNQTAESGLDGLLKSKGSNINAFTSNVHKTRPTSNDISQSMASNIDGSLKKTLEELIGTLKDVGDGFSSIERFSSSLDTLQRYIGRNQTILEKNTKGYKNVTEKLNNLANRAT